MASTLKLYLLLLFAGMSAVRCDKNDDYSGLFRAGNNVEERFEQSLQWNDQHPAYSIQMNKPDYTIALAGDTHIGGTQNFEKLLARSKTPEISALILLGDNVTGRKSDYDALKTLLDSNDSVQCLLVVGNHDLFFDGWPVFLEYFGSSTFTLTVVTPEYADLYICLDTGGGSVGHQQLAWLTSTLGHHREKFRKCVVLTHSNFIRNHFTTSTNPLVEELQVLLELFARHQVDFVITAHDHDEYADVFGPTTYISLGVMRDGEMNPGYLNLSSKNGTLTYSFVRL